MTGTQPEMGSPTGTPSTPFVIQVFGSTISFLKQMAQRPLAFVGMMIVLIFVILALLGPSIAPYDFDEQQPDLNNCLESSNGRQRCTKLTNAEPSAQYILGTDADGRDVLSRVIWGARETIGLPAVATSLAVLSGAAIGLAIGYFGGWVDEVVSRAMDSLLAIPALILALVMLTTIVPSLKSMKSPFIDTIGAEKVSLIIVIVLLYTPIVTRIIRSATLGIRSSGYVESARLRGESLFYILFREILPGVLPALVVEASLRFSYAIFLVASLGFLGLGVNPPSPEWGRMVLEARDNNAIFNAPLSLWAPVVAISILIISVNLMSDGLRRILRYEEGIA